MMKEEKEKRREQETRSGSYSANASLFVRSSDSDTLR